MFLAEFLKRDLFIFSELHLLIPLVKQNLSHLLRPRLLIPNNSNQFSIILQAFIQQIV